VDWQLIRASAAEVASGSRSVVVGGEDNTASGTLSVVGGGYGNFAGAYATIAGGYFNATGVTGDSQFIGGGEYNVTNGYGAAIAGGAFHTANAAYSFVGGGNENTASNDYSSVCGGYFNLASGYASNVAGGEDGTASGGYSSVGGGRLNTASGAYSAVVGGYGATTRGLNGAEAFAATYFAAQGDAQRALYVASGETTTATPLVITLDQGAAGTTNQVVLPNDATYFFKVSIVARRTDADNESAAYTFEGCIDRNANAASTALVGTPVKTILAEDTSAWDVSVSADTTNGALAITVTGQAAKTIRWVAKIETVEVVG
jgi:hypothetical protein